MVSQPQARSSEDDLRSFSQQNETRTPAEMGLPGPVESETPASTTPVLARLPRLLPSSVDESARQQYRLDSPNMSPADTPPKNDSQITPGTSNPPGTPACLEKPLDLPTFSTARPTGRETADSTTEVGRAGSNATEFEVEAGPALKSPATCQPDTRIATTSEPLHVHRTPLARLVVLATLLVAAALSYLLLENQGDLDLKGPHVPQPGFVNEPKLTTTPSAKPTALAETQTRAHTQVQADPPTPGEAEPVAKTEPAAKPEPAAKTNAVAKKDTPGGKPEVTAQGPSGSYQPTTNSRSMSPPLADSSKQLTNTPDRDDSVRNELPARPDRLPFVTAREKRNPTKQAEPPRQLLYPSTGEPALTIFPIDSADYRVGPPAAVAELTGSIEPTTTTR